MLNGAGETMDLRDGGGWPGRFLVHGLLPLVIGLVMLIAGVVLGWEAAARFIKHNDAVNSWTQEASHIAVVAADALWSRLSQMERLMDTQAVELAEGLAAGKLSRAEAGSRLMRVANQSGVVGVVAVFGTDGSPLFASDPALDRPAMTVRARDFFTALRDKGGRSSVTAFYITGPVLGKDPPAMRILLASRLSDPQSGFAGVLVFAVDTDALVRVTVNPSVLLAATIRLFDHDGRLLAALPNRPEDIGKDFAATLAVDAQPLPRQGLAIDPLGGGNEVGALRQIGQTSFLVSVGLGDPTELSDTQQSQTLLFGLAALILIVGGAWLLSHAYPDDEAADGGEEN
jgi:hypothetical protein